MERDGADLIVDSAGEGARVDRYVRDRFPGTSLTLVRRVLDDGEVSVNGRRARKGDRLHEGDRVLVERPPSPADWFPLAEDSARILSVYEDDDVIVVAKPSGVPTVPLRPDEPGTVAGTLLCRYPRLKGIGRTPRDSGLLSRLDAGTSGVLLAAANRRAFEFLAAATAAGRIAKGYLALVEGVRSSAWPPVVRRPLRALGPRGAAVVAGGGSRHEKGVPETRILRARAGMGATLVVAEIRRGERHQIRAHLAAIGHPIIGDVERGGRALEDKALALHAAWVEFPHPRTDSPLRVQAPLMEPLLSMLREVRIPARKREGP